VIELWNLANDPEGLSVQLLLKIRIQQVSHLVLVAYNDKREKVTERGCEIFNSLFFLSNKLLDLLVDLIFDGWAHLYQHCEHAIEVN